MQDFGVDYAYRKPFIKWLINQTINVLVLSLFSVKLMLSGTGGGGLGEQMYREHLLGEDLPPVVETSSTDSPTLTSVKKMMLQMTAYDAKERPSSNSVLRTVQSVYQRVRENLLASST